MPLPKTRPPRIQIEDVWPELDCGRYPVKRSVGDEVEVWARSEEHTSELQSQSNLVCRLLLEKKHQTLKPGPSFATNTSVVSNPSIRTTIFSSSSSIAHSSG